MTSAAKDIPRPLKMPEGKEIPGSAPVVIIGPNGGGKTRLGVRIRAMNDADLIQATRKTYVDGPIRREGLGEARGSLERVNSQDQINWWRESNDVDFLLTALLAEDNADAVSFRNAHARGESPEPKRTRLMELYGMWSTMFPGRRLQLDNHEFKVLHPGTGVVYEGKYLSDGEKAAAYLMARVLIGGKFIVIVDEPEVHFHGRLAARFWNELEDARPECRFVYITHDLPFALSRRNATIVVVRPNTEPQIVTEIPPDIGEELLSVASFSVTAKRIVFCEGEEGRSIDQDVYSAWFDCPETQVMPVGNCTEVVKCCESFAAGKFVRGVDCIGIVDRDFWPDVYLNSVPRNVTVVDVHEVEGLLVMRPVFEAVARHLGTGDIEAKWAAFERQARNVAPGLKGRLVSHRFRRRMRGEFDGALAKLSIDPDLDRMKTGHSVALSHTNWQTNPDTIYDEERARVEQALTGPFDQFLAVFESKPFWKRAPDALGIDPDVYVRQVKQILTGKPSELATLIIDAWKDKLPARRISP